MNEIKIALLNGTTFLMRIHDPSPIPSEPDVWLVRAKTEEGKVQIEYFEAETDLEVVDIINLALEALKNS